MKKFLIVCILAAAGFLCQSCAGPSKHCAAYAQHQPENGPAIEDVN